MLYINFKSYCLEYYSETRKPEIFDVFGDDDPIEMDEEVYHQILLGEDQLTVAYARGSVAVRADHITHVCSRRDRLEGLLPVVEDWHAKQCLLKVPFNQHCDWL